MQRASPWLSVSRQAPADRGYRNDGYSPARPAAPAAGPMARLPAEQAGGQNVLDAIERLRKTGTLADIKTGGIGSAVAQDRSLVAWDRLRAARYAAPGSTRRATERWRIDRSIRSASEINDLPPRLPVGPSILPRSGRIAHALSRSRGWYSVGPTCTRWSRPAPLAISPIADWGMDESSLDSEALSAERRFAPAVRKRSLR